MKTRQPLYDQFADWVTEPDRWDRLHNGPLLWALAPWFAVFIVQLSLMLLYGACRIFLPRRWCP